MKETEERTKERKKERNVFENWDLTKKYDGTFLLILSSIRD